MELRELKKVCFPIIYEKLIAAIWKDEEAKKEFRKAPKEFIQQIAKKHGVNVSFPENISINVVEDTKTSINIVIPENPYQKSDNIQKRRELKNYIDIKASLTISSYTHDKN